VEMDRVDQGSGVWRPIHPHTNLGRAGVERESRDLTGRIMHGINQAEDALKTWQHSWPTHGKNSLDGLRSRANSLPIAPQKECQRVDTC
jgi:hypothetical protein